MLRLRDKLSFLEAKMEKLSPRNRMDRYHQHLDDLEHRFKSSTHIHMEKLRHRIENLEQRLHANSLPATLKRGFSYLSDKDGNLIHSVKNLVAGKQVKIHLQDGNKVVEVQADDLGLN
jgi:exodeoxyribonuclease VII large subunit